MTRYEQGFLTKCAEYGIDETDGLALLHKLAAAPLLNASSFLKLGKKFHHSTKTYNKYRNKLFDLAGRPDSVGDKANLLWSMIDGIQPGKVTNRYYAKIGKYLSELFPELQKSKPLKAIGNSTPMATALVHVPRAKSMPTALVHVPRAKSMTTELVPVPRAKSMSTELVPVSRAKSMSTEFVPATKKK